MGLINFFPCMDHLLNIVMEIIDGFLKGVEEEDLKGYKAHLHTHIKSMLTNLNKKLVEDTSLAAHRRNKCIYSCYRGEISKIPKKASSEAL